MTSTENPTIQIEGFTYQLKFGAGAQLRLERMGFSQKDIQAAYVYETKADGSSIATECKIPLTMLFLTIAACAGVPKLGGRWKPIALTAEEIADLSTQEDITAMSKAVGEMWSKAQPAGAQPATQPATQPETQKAN